jgi:hypothetical protein
MKSIGIDSNQILDAFRRIDRESVGRRITEAHIVGSSMRFRWQTEKLGVVVGDYCIRDASDAEYAELEEATELGQTEIYSLPLYVSGRSARDRIVLHQATGNPIDPNSLAARRQRERWNRAYPRSL